MDEYTLERIEDFWNFVKAHNDFCMAARKEHIEGEKFVLYIDFSQDVLNDFAEEFIGDPDCSVHANISLYCVEVDVMEMLCLEPEVTIEDCWKYRPDGLREEW